MRVYIFGASGSGTSTLGRELQDHCFRWLDTDDFFWMPTDPPYTVKRPTAERVRLLSDELTREGDVVLSGSVGSSQPMWGAPLLPMFDLAVFMFTPHDERIKRLRRREHEKLGDRIFEGGDMHENHEEFIAWAGRYDTEEGYRNGERSLASDEYIIEHVLTCPVLRLSGVDSPDKNAKLVIERLKTL